MGRSPALAALALTLAALTACGGDDVAEDDAAASATSVAGAEADADQGPSVTENQADADSIPATTTTTTTTTAEPPPTQPARPALGLPEMALLTEPSEDQRPLLEWEPVEGAAQYSVSVFAPSGEGYWAWRTEGTSVPLGGEPRLRDEVSGPSTAPGMTWSVLALDADGRPIAASVESLLRP